MFYAFASISYCFFFNLSILATSWLQYYTTGSRYVPRRIGWRLKVRRRRGTATAAPRRRPGHGVRRDSWFLEGRRDSGCLWSAAGRGRYGSSGWRLLLADHSGGSGVMVWLDRCCGDGCRRRGGIRRCRRVVVLHHSGDGQWRWRRWRRGGTRRHAGDTAAEHQVQVRFGVVERTQLTLDQLALFVVVCVVHLEHAVETKELERGRRTRWWWERYYNITITTTTTILLLLLLLLLFTVAFTRFRYYTAWSPLSPLQHHPVNPEPRDVTRGAQLQFAFFIPLSYVTSYYFTIIYTYIISPSRYAAVYIWCRYRKTSTGGRTISERTPFHELSIIIIHSKVYGRRWRLM